MVVSTWILLLGQGRCNKLCKCEEKWTRDVKLLKPEISAGGYR